MSLHPQITRETKNVKYSGYFLNEGEKTLVFSSRKLRVDFVHYLVTFLLSVDADFISSTFCYGVRPYSNSSE